MHTTTMENLKMIAYTDRDFADINLRPHIMEWDENTFFFFFIHVMLMYRQRYRSKYNPLLKIWQKRMPMQI